VNKKERCRERRKKQKERYKYLVFNKRKQGKEKVRKIERKKERKKEINK
jgi:hypothetical protein